MAEPLEVTLLPELQCAVGALMPSSDEAAVFGSAANDSFGASQDTSLIEQQVLISKVQFENRANQPSRDETKTVAPTVDMLLTLAVDDTAAQRILFSAEHGEVWLGAEQKSSAAAGAVR